MNDPKEIWLAPGCDCNDDCEWCEHDVWEPCEDCGRDSVHYVLASDYDACASRLHEVAEVCAIAEQERDTFKAECVNINNILDQIRIERDALRAQVEVMRDALLSLLTLDIKGHHLLERLQFSTMGREILDKVNTALKANP